MSLRNVGRRIREQIQVIHQGRKCNYCLKSQYRTARISKPSTSILELTVLEKKPRVLNMEDETTYNEIASLRRIRIEENKS